MKPPLVQAKIRTVFQRGEAPEILDLEATANLDPLEILKAAGVGILVGGVSLVAGWVLWEGLTLAAPAGPIKVIDGLKEIPFWRDQAENAQKSILAWQEKRRQCRDLKVGLEKLQAELAEQLAEEQACIDAARARNVICRAACADSFNRADCSQRCADIMAQEIGACQANVESLHVTIAEFEAAIAENCS